jgi:hypothetical protein
MATRTSGWPISVAAVLLGILVSLAPRGASSGGGEEPFVPRLYRPSMNVEVLSDSLAWICTVWERTDGATELRVHKADPRTGAVVDSFLISAEAEHVHTACDLAYVPERDSILVIADSNRPEAAGRYPTFWELSFPGGIAQVDFLVEFSGHNNHVAPPRLELRLFAHEGHVFWRYNLGTVGNTLALYMDLGSLISGSFLELRSLLFLGRRGCHDTLDNVVNSSTVDFEPVRTGNDPELRLIGVAGSHPEDGCVKFIDHEVVDFTPLPAETTETVVHTARSDASSYDDAVLDLYGRSYADTYIAPDEISHRFLNAPEFFTGGPRFHYATGTAGTPEVGGEIILEQIDLPGAPSAVDVELVDGQEWWVAWRNANSNVELRRVQADVMADAEDRKLLWDALPGIELDATFRGAAVPWDNDALHLTATPTGSLVVTHWTCPSGDPVDAELAIQLIGPMIFADGYESGNASALATAS